jgi:hypothetical protein
MKNITFLFSLILLFSSCDVIIDLDIPEHEPVLVVNSVLSTDSIMTAYVSHSKGAFDSNPISYVNNASVKVFEDGVLLGEMDKILTPSFNYSGFVDTVCRYSLNQTPAAGKFYSYEVEHDDYENARAETPIPTAVDLIIEEVSPVGEDDYEKQFRLRCSFEDAGTENYYRLRIHAESDDAYFYTNYFVDFESSDASIIASAGVQSDGMSYWGSDALFDDELFNGSTKVITLEFWDWNYYYFEEEGYDVNYVLEVSSISKEYFNYIKSLRAYENNANQFSLFAGEPVHVYTNIENGLGILGASNTKSVEFILPE